MRIKEWILLLIAMAGAVHAGEPVSHLPRSNEAFLVESVSATEVRIEATGIGIGKKKYLMDSADLDARRSALNFVLTGGTDPLLTSAAEKEQFAHVAESFFAPDTANSFISWAQKGVVSRVKIRKGKALKLTRQFVVNSGQVRNWLVAHAVLASVSQLRDLIGMPFIMVLPQVGKGENPLTSLVSNDQLRQAAGVIESFLTARRYDVVVPEQAATMQSLNDAQLMVKDVEEDMAYKLALTQGCDVYITYGVTVDHQLVGGTRTGKASVSVKAFETTTARNLGSETGYSHERPVADNALVEEAVNDAIDKVLSRLTSYWKEDVQRGIQYRIIFNVNGDFGEDELEEMQDLVPDALDHTCRTVKENIIGDKTMDYIVWVDPAVADRSSRLYRQLREYVKDSGDGVWRLRKININRKMLLLKIGNS